VLEGLQRRVVLVTANLSSWDGVFQIKNAEVAIAGQTANEKHITRPRLKCWTATPELQEVDKAITKITSYRDAVLDHYGLAHPGLRGVRMVPLADMPNVLYELIGRNRNGVALFDPERRGTPVSRNTVVQSVKYRITEVQEQIRANWSRWRDDMARKLADNGWAAIADRVPVDGNKIASRFDLHVGQLAITGGRTDVLAGEDFEQYRDIIQQNARARVDDMVDAVIRGPREELSSALAELQALIARDGTVTDRSFNAMRTAFSKLQRFEFVADERLMEQMRTINTALDRVQPNQLNSDTLVSTGLSTAITEARSTLDDASHVATIQGRAVRAMRRIQL
jgi:hypothetical protein